MKSVNIGICGLGTVGGGTFNVLARNKQWISARTGCDIRVSHVAIRSPKPEYDLSDVVVESDVLAVAKADGVDIVVETIGGYDLAKELVLTAIEHGKHVVTANKALVAEHGNEIFAKAEEKGVSVFFEAAVAGGIPVIKALREGLAGNEIEWLTGIINGTGNFILTEMKDKGRDFADVLKEAQDLGYAEADPTFDVEGIDACHKLVILASLAFGIPLSFDKAFTEGISKVAPEDVSLAQELGFNIKHLGIAKRVEVDGEAGVELRVHPTLIPHANLIANVHGVMNAVMIKGDAVGPTMYYGAGAGAEPTASSIVGDICDIARQLDAPQSSKVPALAYLPNTIDAASVLPIESVVTEYYLRFEASDEAGVMKQVTQALSDAGISIEAMIQKTPNANKVATVALITDQVQEAKLQAAVKVISEFGAIQNGVKVIRVESMA